MSKLEPFKVLRTRGGFIDTIGRRLTDHFAHTVSIEGIESGVTKSSVLTHISSGMSVCTVALRDARVLAEALEALPGVDWEQSDNVALTDQMREAMGTSFKEWCSGVFENAKGPDISSVDKLLKNACWKGSSVRYALDYGIPRSGSGPKYFYAAIITHPSGAEAVLRLTEDEYHAGVSP